MTEDLIIGVDMGATNLRVGVVKNNRLLLCRTAEIHKTGSGQEVVNQIIGLIEGMPQNSYRGIGVGVPSVVDIDKGIVYDVQNLPSWKEVPLKDILEKKFNLPVFVNNDANCFVLGEKYFGKGAKANTIIGLTIGSGLGSGLILNGKLFPGANCGAGEVGMFSYKDGIIEQYCSGQFFETFHHIKGKKVFEMANAGDTKALEIFEEFGTHLAKAIENVIYAYDPDLIVIGGSLRNAFSFYQKAMWNSLQNFPYTRSIKNIRIEVSEEEHIAVMGAAALVIDALKLE